MGQYITSIVEIRDAGISLRSDGEHVIQVLGARKDSAIVLPSGPKEDLAIADFSEYNRLLAGELKPPPDEAGAPEGPFLVPQVYATDGRVQFLKRGGA
jgi:hypothetical protein